MEPIFSEEEIKKYNITPWKYETTSEKGSIYIGEEHSHWDYKENHLRFRDILDGKEWLLSFWSPIIISKKIGEIGQW